MRSILFNTLATLAMAAPFNAALAQSGDPTIPGAQPWVRLSIANADYSMTDEATLHFGIGAPGEDPMDVAKPDDLSTMPLYIAILDYLGNPMALSAHGPLMQEVVVPIELRADIGDLYTITVRDLGSLNGKTCIYLIDLETGETHTLEEGLQLTVPVHAGEPNGARFKLHVHMPTKIVLEHALCHSGSDGQATLHPSGNGPWNITWLNYEQLELAQQAGATGTVTQDGLYPGNWTAVVEALDGCGTQSFPIIIEKPQELSITTLPIAPACHLSSDGSIQLNPAGGTAPYQFNWSNGDQTQDLMGVPAGTYSVDVVDANGCSTTFSGLSIQAPAPIAGEVVAPHMINRFEPLSFSSTAAAGVSRTWDFGDGTGSLVPEPLHAYQDLGIFTIRLTLNDGACSTLISRDILVQGTVGVGEFDSDEVRAWSAAGMITVNNPLHSDLHLHIYDATGRITTTTRVPAQTRRLEISTAGWSQGLYFLNASTPWEQWTFSLPVVE